MGKIISLKEKRRRRKMGGYSIAEIEDKATEILKRCNMEDQIPIDPILIANELGIRIYAGNFINDDISGVIMKNGDAVEMLIREDHPVNRRRFTIAHELGHHELHINSEDLEEKDHVEYERSGIKTLEEREADSFAAALLMPRQAIEREYDNYSDLSGLPNILISLLATKFQVSEQAMKIRLANLGLIYSGW